MLEFVSNSDAIDLSCRVVQLFLVFHFGDLVGDGSHDLVNVPKRLLSMCAYSLTDWIMTGWHSLSGVLYCVTLWNHNTNPRLCITGTFQWGQFGPDTLNDPKKHSHWSPSINKEITWQTTTIHGATGLGFCSEITAMTVVNYTDILSVNGRLEENCNGCVPWDTWHMLINPWHCH
jgi:hypothetical protein